MRNLAIAVTALWLASCAGAQPDKVDQAFSRARQGDYTALEALSSLGPSAAPAVARYLQDPEPVLRIEALGLLEGYRACGELRSALTNSEAEVRERAAMAFFKACGRRPVDEQTADALQRSVREGNTSPVALLLLGESSRPEDVALLREKLSATGMVKWSQDAQPVPESLVASLALWRSGDEEARTLVRTALEKPVPSTARFFLDALPFVDDPQLLGQISGLLQDTRPVPGERRRRICDHAVTAFASRFALKLSFEPRDFGQFDEKQIEEVRQSVREHLASMR